MHAAAEGDNLDVLRSLLVNGASVNAKNSEGKNMCNNISSIYI